VAHLRSDRLHKLTTALATTYGTVVVEDLNVAGMCARARGRGKRAKAGLNRAVLDASFGELRRQLAYKCAWYGSRLVVAGRWYPSSKTCSACGAAKAKLPLSQRCFTCEACGLVLDRDHNAALNLAALAADVAASGAETQNGRGGERLQAGSISRCSPAKRQAGSPPGQRSGTAALQETAV
jgi:putative transposase